MTLVDKKIIMALLYCSLNLVKSLYSRNMIQYLVNIATSSTTYVSRSRICLLLSEFIWINSSEVIADWLHTVMTIKCIKNSKTSNPNTKISFKLCVFSQSYHDELTRQLQWLYDHWPDWLYVYTKVELVLQFFKKQN